jgi:hypothetical protein
MASIDELTAEYVDSLSTAKFASRTGDAVEFDFLKSFYDTFLSDLNIPDEKHVQMLALLILHHYAMDDTASADKGSRGGTGNVVSRSVGDVSLSYGSVPLMSDTAGWKMYLTQSKWGQMYLMTLKTFRSSFIVLG